MGDVGMNFFLRLDSEEGFCANSTCIKITETKNKYILLWFKLVFIG